MMRWATALAIFALAGCACKYDDDQPKAPYNSPSNVSRYSAGSYEAVTFTYYCSDGWSSYGSFTYSRDPSACEPFALTSQFTSACRPGAVIDTVYFEREVVGCGGCVGKIFRPGANR